LLKSCATPPASLEALGLPEPLLESPPRGDVARRDDHSADGRIVEQVQPDGLHQPPAPILVTGTELLRHDALIVERACEQLLEDRSVVRMNETERGGTDELVHRVAEDARHRRAGVLHAHVGVEDPRDVDRVLDQRAEACFAALQRRDELRSSLLDPAFELIV
jgi:hypothetical protein